MNRTLLTLTGVTLLTVILGLFIWPTAFIYGTEPNSATVYRVNRFSGMKEISSDYGWKTYKELDQIARAELEREKAAYQKRTASFIQDAVRGEIVSANWEGRQLTVQYKDGRSETAMAWTPYGDDPAVTRALELNGVPFRGTYATTGGEYAPAPTLDVK